MSVNPLTRSWVDQHLEAGWPVLPLPPMQKAPPPEGATGAAGVDLTREELLMQLQENSNTGIRMPETVLGIDVDAYGEKVGETTMQWLEWGPPGREDEALGPLPSTYRITSRSPRDASGIYFYRVPAGIEWGGNAGRHVDLLSHGYRYAVAPPSVHPEGREYRWFTPSGVTCGVPQLSDLAELPPRWVEGLPKASSRRLASGEGAGKLSDAEIARSLDAFASGPACSCVRGPAEKLLAAARRELGGAHDELKAPMMRLVSMGLGGCRGASEVLSQGFTEYSAWDPGHARDYMGMLRGAFDKVGLDPWVCPDRALETFEVWGPEAVSSSAPVREAEEDEEVGDVFIPPVEVKAEPPPPPNEIERMIRKETMLLTVREEARRRVQQTRDAADWSLPESRFSLKEELEIEDPPVEWVVEGLLERGTNLLVEAGYKVGKTTLVLNMMGSLADGRDFLGRYSCTSMGRVAWWNFELTERQSRRWLREMEIENLDQVSVLHMRGHKLPLHSDHVRDELVAWLKERDIDTLVVDPYGSAYNKRENDNDDVREWTTRLDEIKRLASVSTCVLVAHTGRADAEPGEEHARGAAKLDDWADVRWVYSKDKDRENGSRYLYAFGRDVDVEEVGLAWDPATRRLTVDTDAPRRGGKGATSGMVRKVLETAAGSPGLNRKDLVAAVGGASSQVQKAVSKAIDDGLLVQVAGAKPNEKLHEVSPAYLWAMATETTSTTA